MGEAKRSKLIAFFSGDFTVTMAIILGVLNDFGPFALKAVATLVIGIIGGFAGIAGKDLYSRVKRWYNRRKEKKNKQP